MAPPTPKVSPNVEERPKKQLRRRPRQRKQAGNNTHAESSTPQTQGLEPINTQISTSEAATIEPLRTITEAESEQSRLGKQLNTQISTSEAATIEPLRTITEAESEQSRLGEQLNTRSSTTGAETFEEQRTREYQEMADYTTKTSRKLGQMKGLDRKIQELLKERDQAEASIQVLETEKEGLRGELAVAKGSLIQAKAENFEKEKRIQAAESAAELADTDWKKTIEKFKDRHRENQRTLAEQKEVTRGYKKLQEETLAELNSVTKRAEEYSNDLDKLHDQLETAEKFFELPLGSLHGTKEDIYELEDAKKHFKECGDGLQGDIDMLQALLDEKNTQIDSKDSDIHRLSNELKAIKRQNQDPKESTGDKMFNDSAAQSANSQSAELGVSQSRRDKRKKERLAKQQGKVTHSTEENSIGIDAAKMDRDSSRGSKTAEKTGLGVECPAGGQTLDRVEKADEEDVGDGNTEPQEFLEGESTDVAARPQTQLRSLDQELSGHEDLEDSEEYAPEQSAVGPITRLLGIQPEISSVETKATMTESDIQAVARPYLSRSKITTLLDIPPETQAIVKKITMAEVGVQAIVQPYLSRSKISTWLDIQPETPAIAEKITMAEAGVQTIAQPYLSRSEISTVLDIQPETPTIAKTTTTEAGVQTIAQPNLSRSKISTLLDVQPENGNTQEKTTLPKLNTTTTAMVGVQTDPLPFAIFLNTENQPSWFTYLQGHHPLQIIGLFLVFFLLTVVFSTFLSQWIQGCLAQKEWNMYQLANSKAVRLGPQITSHYARQIMRATPSNSGASWMTPDDVMKIHAALASSFGEGASGLY